MYVIPSIYTLFGKDIRSPVHPFSVYNRRLSFLRFIIVE